MSRYWLLLPAAALLAVTVALTRAPAKGPGVSIGIKLAKKGAVQYNLDTGTLESHSMTMDGDVMKMRRVEDGLEIPAGGEVVLKPGGLHVMFRRLAAPLKEGELRPVKLVFEKAGEVEVEFIVEGMGAPTSGGHQHGQ